MAFPKTSNQFLSTLLSFSLWFSHIDSKFCHCDPVP
jgi:hypothetical protein